MNNIWVIANRLDSIKELCSGAAALGGQATLVYSGSREWACNAAKAYYFGDGTQLTVAETAAEMAKFAADNGAELVLCDTTQDGRLIASYVACALNAGVVADAMEVVASENGLETSRMVYGGSAFKREVIAKGAICCCGGTFEVGECVPAGEIIDVAAGGTAEIHLVNKQEKQASSVNLAAAKKLVVVGRGIGNEENMELAREFAALIGAEIGCTRPVAEELQFMPREAYIGVSGVIVSPELLISIGVSGQVQHTVGTSQAGTIVAINSDKKAPIFDGCDYGIVGDLKVVLPDLIAKIKG